MLEGDILTLTIHHLGSSGDGVAYAEPGRKTIYVPLALQDEVVKARLVRKIDTGYGARLLEVITPSPLRTAPPCPHFSKCGGCVSQHMQDGLYRDWKVGLLKPHLKRHGLETAPLKPLIVVPAGSRRRITLAMVADKSGRTTLGFTERSSHNTISIQSCSIADPDLVAMFPLLKDALTPWAQKARMLDLLLTKLDNGLDLLITGPEADLPAREAIIALARHEKIARISWRARVQDTPEPMAVQRAPIIKFADTPVAVPAGGFLQATQQSEQAMASLLQEAAKHALAQVKSPVIVELFAGAGSFSLPLAQIAPVATFEGDKAAVHALHAATQASKLPHKLTATQRDLFRDPLTASELADLNAALVVLDPPRAGAQAQCAEIAKAPLSTVLMVSCSPNSFARDAATLLQAGFVCDWIQPIDQFLWSPHLELIGQFTRRAD